MSSAKTEIPNSDSGAGRWLVAIAYSDLASDNRVIRAARAAADAGWRVTVVVPQSKVRDFELDSVEIEWLPVEQERGRTTILGQLRFLLAVSRWASGQPGIPDVVHVHNMPDYLYWAVWKWHRRGSRVVVDVHDIMSELAIHRFAGLKRYPMSRLLRILERAVWRRADQLITVHAYYRDAIVSANVPPEKVTVVLNVPDADACNPSMRRPPPGDQFKIVFHGTVSERTGIAHAVKAMPIVLEKVPNARLVVIGDGNGASEVHRLVKSLGLESSIEFINRFIPMSDVIRHICDAHAAVVPNELSIYTRGILPVKLLEYSALQIPVVATRLPLIDHYFGDECLHFIPEPTPELIAEGLIKLAGDPSYGARLVAATRDFQDHHSWEAYRPKLLTALSNDSRRDRTKSVRRARKGESDCVQTAEIRVGRLR